MQPLLPEPRGHGAREALRLGHDTLTFDGLHRLARSHAGRLMSEGLKPGDRVAVWATPDVAAIVAMVGNALYGAPTVPLNPSLGAKELGHVLADSAPKLILAARPAEFADRTPGVRGITLDGPDFTPGERAADDPLLVLYTSGTTGAPKGAILTHLNAAFDLDALADAWAWTADDVLVHALPLFHVHGLVLGVFGSLRAGSTLRLLPRFSPEAICAAMHEGGTMLFGVPTMYHRLAEHAEADPAAAKQLGAARLLVSGSAALPVREHERLFRATGQRVVERYGLTETLINCSVRHDGERRAGTVGRALPGIELRLLDEERRPLAPGRDVLGEIAVRGPNVFAGYLNRPDATAAALDREGFFCTGDIANVEPDGYVRIVGRRATDLIKTGGFKVGAGEVEGALLEHPAVREAAVIGAPHDDLGEQIVAFVALREGARAEAQELIDYVAGQLAPHKRPRAVRFVDALPRNAMGKVLKKELARMA